MLVPIYQTTRCRNPQIQNINLHRCENFRHLKKLHIKTLQLIWFVMVKEQQGGPDRDCRKMQRMIHESWIWIHGSRRKIIERNGQCSQQNGKPTSKWNALYFTASLCQTLPLKILLRIREFPGSHLYQRIDYPKLFYVLLSPSSKMPG
jgi:hypothetical protein